MWNLNGDLTVRRPLNKEQHKKYKQIAIRERKAKKERKEDCCLLENRLIGRLGFVCLVRQRPINGQPVAGPVGSGFRHLTHVARLLVWPFCISSFKRKIANLQRSLLVPSRAPETSSRRDQIPICRMNLSRASARVRTQSTKLQTIVGIPATGHSVFDIVKAPAQVLQNSFAKTEKSVKTSWH